MQETHDEYNIKVSNEDRIQYYISWPFLPHLTLVPIKFHL